METKDRIRGIYEDSGFTYEELSRITGIKLSTITAWLSGYRTPPEYVVNYIELMVKDYKSGKREYIDKKTGARLLMHKVYDTFDSETAKKIMDMYESLPTVFK